MNKVKPLITLLTHHHRVECSNAVKTAKKHNNDFHELKHSDGSMVVSKACLETKKLHRILIRKENLKAYIGWRNGKAKIESLNFLSKDDREFLKSGVSPKGWKKRFNLNHNHM
jgi:hypothetical protein